MSLGLQIKTARQAKGITQEQLAKSVGVSRRVIISYEMNKTVPRDTTLEQLNAVLGTSLVAEPERIPSSTVDYRQIVKYSTESEKLSALFAPIFNFVEAIAGNRLSAEDKKGIDEFRKVHALYEQRKSLDEERRRIEDALAALRQSLEN